MQVESKSGIAHVILKEFAVVCDLYSFVNVPAFINSLLDGLGSVGSNICLLHWKLLDIGCRPC